MMIDEAIEQEKFKARVDRIKANKRIFHNNDEDEISACHRSAEEHDQIAEWLEELKAYQQQHLEICEKYGVNTIEDLYDKAIDDFAKLVETWCWKHEQYNQDDLNTLMDIAKQLKAGD